MMGSERRTSDPRSSTDSRADQASHGGVHVDSVADANGSSQKGRRCRARLAAIRPWGEVVGDAVRDAGAAVLTRPSSHRVSCRHARWRDGRGLPATAKA